MNYSPGPWKKAEDGFGIQDSRGVQVLLEGFSLGKDCCSRGNDALVITAPELLEELEKVQDLLSMLACMDHREDIEQKIYTQLDSMEHLIAKAKGES